MIMLDRDFDLGILKDHRVLVLPSGIGEFQWVMSKMVNTGERLAILALDGAPRRLHQFAEVHPTVDYFGWSGQDYTSLRMFQDMHGLTTWARVKELFGLGQPVMMACNPALERGVPLAEWMPDLPTSYQYLVDIPNASFEQADAFFQGHSRDYITIGISCASYRGSAAWSTWDEKQWGKFLHLVNTFVPRARFCMLGGSWDDLSADVFEQNQDLRWLVDPRGRPPIGTLKFNTTMALLRMLDGYIGFSSGLGHVAAHLCSTPVAMLWPEHEQVLSKTWVDPQLLASGFYVPSRWLSPETVFATFSPWLEFIQER